MKYVQTYKHAYNKPQLTIIPHLHTEDGKGNTSQWKLYMWKTFILSFQLSSQHRKKTLKGRNLKMCMSKQKQIVIRVNPTLGLNREYSIIN